jgi:hypothetical protein
MGYEDYGFGSGSGAGIGSGEGSGYNKEKRHQIELNILRHIPDSDLPLFIGEWQFEETKKLFEDKLKRS